MNKDINAQFKKIANILNSGISDKSKMELCKKSWEEYDRNNVIISNKDYNLIDSYNEKYKKVQ